MDNLLDNPLTKPNILQDLLICPITLQIFLEPVCAADGHIYELTALLDCLKLSNKSPTTNMPMNAIYTPAYLIKNLVDKLLEENPELKKEQFIKKIDNSINSNINSTNSTNNTNNIVNINSTTTVHIVSDKGVFSKFVKNKLFNQLYNYISRFDNHITLTIDDNCEDIFKNDEIAKLLIDKNVTIKDHKTWTLLHFVCRYSSFEIIKYIIKKYISENKSIEYKVFDNWIPIHIICRYAEPPAVKYIIDTYIELKLDLECELLNGWRPVHLICRFSTIELFTYIVSKGVDINTNVYKYNGISCDYTLDQIIEKRFDGDNCQNKQLHDQFLSVIHPPTTRKNRFWFF